MKGSDYLIWFRRLLVLGAVVAGGTTSAAGSATNPAGGRNAAVPDAIERYAAAHPYGTTSIPDVIERYAAAHPFGRGLVTSAPTTDRIVDDWFRDQPNVATGSGDRIVDDWFRDQPNVATQAGDRIVDDSFRDTVQVTIPQSSSSGLDWGDFGIGAGAMLGLTMLVAGLALGAVALRHRSGRLGTS
jgi:hypothetical protein